MGIFDFVELVRGISDWRLIKQVLKGKAAMNEDNPSDSYHDYPAADFSVNAGAA
jgi:hypothetical protein